MNQRLLRIAGIGVGSLVLTLWGAGSAFAEILDTPALTVLRTGRTVIVLDVVAGATGAPGGFRVEWMRSADFNGEWPSEASAPGLVHCDFVGQPTLNTENGTDNFVLDENGAARVEIGDTFDETGVVASDYSEMAEGTEYVLRARALGAPGWEESVPTATVIVATDSALPRGCTGTWGFWRNHPDLWPSDTVQLGDRIYTQSELMSIFETPARGNGLISLAHQLIAAELGVMNGAAMPSEVADAASQAHDLIGSLVVPPVDGSTDALSPGLTGGLTQVIDSYNTGQVGPGHCEAIPVEAITWGAVKARGR